MTGRILDTVTTERPQTGIKVIIAGVEKIGKTTLAATTPAPLMIPIEQGIIGVPKGIPITRIMNNYSDIEQLLGELAQEVSAGTNQYRTLVFDSLTALERMINEAIIKRDTRWKPGNPNGVTLESALGGYGNGYSAALELFNTFLSNCEWFMLHGINIVCTCHVFASVVKDPTAGEYHAWDLLLHSPNNNKTYGKRALASQWADMVGFLHEPIVVRTLDETARKNGLTIQQAVTLNRGRVLGVNRTPAYIAGNRFGIVDDTIQIPILDGWNAIANAIYQAKGLDYFKR